MTDEELGAIEARAGAATPGPWGYYGDTHPAWAAGHAGSYVYSRSAPVKVCQLADPWQHNPNKAIDAAFIASARADVPALVAEVRRLHAVREAVLREVNWLAQAAQHIDGTDGSNVRGSIARLWIKAEGPESDA